MLAVVQPNYDFKLLNNKLAKYHTDEYTFAYVDVYTEYGELVKATFECALLPQLFLIQQTSSESVKTVYHFDKRLSSNAL